MTPTDQTEQAASAELAPIRRSAVYHLVRLHLERLLTDGARLRTRRCSLNVGVAAHWVEAAHPGIEVDEGTAAVALADLGFDLHQRRDGRLFTNVRERPLHLAFREAIEADAPLVCERGVWRREFPAFDARWPERLARIDAAVAAAQRAH
ncbi:MAG TPA: hypothetical protein VFR90_03260 [Methylibium sp.]|uniref:hypothetical protein n=1 Tax=Methylibium sp. TaxID=2067992 RepID=UPI002DB95216|nr:hypothetical protein [Methylibium sp.]HEU4458119.1 hypothetical protein [Methylibium sp.]